MYKSSLTMPSGGNGREDLGGKWKEARIRTGPSTLDDPQTEEIAIEYTD